MPMNRLIQILSIVLIFGPTGANTVECAAPVARPNVLFLLSDDQRPDTIHALGGAEQIRTPHLDQLVHRGTAFTRATCANPICTPSRAEIMTGASGLQNGVLDFGKPIRPEMALWSDTMRSGGYETWYIGKWHNDGRPSQRGFAHSRGLFAGGGGPWAVPTFDWNGRGVTGYRGWVFQTDDRRFSPERGVGLTPGISADFADAAISILREKRDRPFFIQVNFTAPHDPLLMPFGYEKMYNPADIPVPENFLAQHPFDHGNFDGRDEQLLEWPRTRHAIQRELAVYYAVISHMDAQIGRILSTLAETGQLDNTLVIFASDHGLAVGSHGLRGKQNMYDHTIGVPLIFAGPGVPRGKRSTAQCYLRDLFPTVCELVGLKIPETVEARSLKPVLTEEADTIYQHVFGYFRDKQRMIRTDRWKLIRYPHLDREQLFDLQNDPHELHDLSSEAQHAGQLAELRATLQNWQRQHHDPVLRSE